MNQLGLEVTRPYGNICEIDSKQVEVHKVIRDLKVNLNAYSDISTLMDVIVVDIPASYGMLLSRKWGSNIGGTIQMDLSYASFPNYKGEMITVYREPFFSSHVHDVTLHVQERVEKGIPSQSINMVIQHDKVNHGEVFLSAEGSETSCHPTHQFSHLFPKEENESLHSSFDEFHSALSDSD